MANAQIKIEGLEQLVKNLRQLPKELQGKPLQQAVGRASRVVRDEAKKRAPQGSYANRSENAPEPGRLHENIVSAKRKSQGGADMEYLVMVRTRGKKDSRKNAWYWHFLEFGTSKQPAQPFLRPAFEAKKSEALQEMVKYLRKGIERAAKKLKK